MSTPGKIDLVNAAGRRWAISLGATTVNEYFYTSGGTGADPDDLSNDTATFIVKRSTDDTEAAVLTLTESTGIFLGDGQTNPNDPNVVITFDEAAIAAIEANKYQYTFNVTNQSNVTQRFWEGNITFTRET